MSAQQARVIGNPSANNLENIRILKNALNRGNPDHKDLRVEIFKHLNPDLLMLDCGKSTREFFAEIQGRVRNLETLDINQFEDYPTFQMDLCEIVKNNPLYGRYDIIACYSVLEHCYNPFLAAENLLEFLKPGGKLFGYVPFLFPHHGPNDNSYQDYFRFTNSGIAIMFRHASRIEITSDRGRLATAAMILTTKYKYWIEKRFPKLTKYLNRLLSENSNFKQSSGYYFMVIK